MIELKSILCNFQRLVYAGLLEASLLSQISLPHAAPSDMSPYTLHCFHWGDHVSSNNSLIKHCAVLGVQRWKKQSLFIEVQKRGLSRGRRFRQQDTGYGRGKHRLSEACVGRAGKPDWRGQGVLVVAKATELGTERGAGASCRASILGRRGYVDNDLERLICIFWVKMCQRQWQERGWAELETMDREPVSQAAQELRTGLLRGELTRGTVVWRGLRNTSQASAWRMGGAAGLEAGNPGWRLLPYPCEGDTGLFYNSSIFSYLCFSKWGLCWPSIHNANFFLPLARLTQIYFSLGALIISYIVYNLYILHFILPH